MSSNTKLECSIPILCQGSKGESVKLLQEILKYYFDYSLKADGEFGLNTEAAVKHLQEQRGLTADGIVNSNTWDILSRKPGTLPMLYCGSQGSDVKFLQKRLALFGYSVEIDGDFGGKTEAIVKKFQQDHNLKVDGVVEQKLWQLLSQIYYY